MALLIIDPAFQPEMAKLGLNSFEALQELFAQNLPKPLTPALSPSDGERVAEGRVKGLLFRSRNYFGNRSKLGDLEANMDNRGEDSVGR